MDTLSLVKITWSSKRQGVHNINYEYNEKRFIFISEMFVVIWTVRYLLIVNTFLLLFMVIIHKSVATLKFYDPVLSEMTNTYNISIFAEFILKNRVV